MSDLRIVCVLRVADASSLHDSLPNAKRSEDGQSTDDKVTVALTAKESTRAYLFTNTI